MFKNPSGRIFDIIEYASMGPNEIVRRLPEGGTGNFRLGSQVRVYDGQAAGFESGRVSRCRVGFADNYLTFVFDPDWRHEYNVLDQPYTSRWP